MEIKVKSLDSVPEKSVQEVEENLLQKHEEEKSEIGRASCRERE